MNDSNFTVSYEIRSPERGTSLENYMMQLTPLLSFKPSFVSIANHQPEEKFITGTDGNLKKAIPDRYPATYFFSVALKERFGVDVIPHLLCNELDPEIIDDILLGFHYVGIKKIMALRGDRTSNNLRFPNRYSYSSDLVKHIVEFGNNYNIVFDIGIAGYPEKHPAAVSFEDDLAVLKDKIRLGASFITTQMFLDNGRFYSFLDRCKVDHIFVPIYPGLKLILKPSNLDQYSDRFQIEIPNKLKSSFSSSYEDNHKKTGENWLFEQCNQLIKDGHNHLHFYVFSKDDMIGVFNVISKLKRQYYG
ncbi:methylenetetrahydrofolate reductase [Chryseobacterium sp.]|uniref:methylenetetrahydrofolate reductase n=1 Tax=Chryseobacterium sp. TaxID=1871047 RepID=UPI00289F5E22|nr:methylenetetrahydrofolate reductase [Chryseobacterium sp.]